MLNKVKWFEKSTENAFLGFRNIRPITLVLIILIFLISLTIPFLK